jgi:hypothetical protein
MALGLYLKIAELMVLPLTLSTNSATSFALHKLHELPS